MIEANDTTFAQEVTASTTPVLVDFYADWCMPCRMIAPLLDKLSKEYDGRVKFVKVDTETGGESAKAHNISSIPTLLLFKDGVLVERLSGIQSEANLKT